MSVKRNLVYIVNPISGGNKNRSKLLNCIDDAMRTANYHYTILASNAAGNYTFLKNYIVEHSVTDVIVCGGDGTVSQVMAALLGVPVIMGIIPVGSGNGLAFALDIPKNYSKALAIIVDNYYADIDGFWVNSRFGCMLAGLGFDAQIAHNFVHSKKRGLQSYLKESIITYTKANAYPFEIEVHGKIYKTAAFFISIANSNQFGNHVTIAPKASLHDGLLDVIVVRKTYKTLLPMFLLRQILYGAVTNELNHSVRVNYIQASTLTIYNPALAPLHIDGEPQPTNSKITFTIEPQAARMLQPRKNAVHNGN